MEPRTRSIMDPSFVKLLTQAFNMIAAPRIGPAVNLCRRLAVRIDADKAVPKRTRRDMTDLAFNFFRFSQNFVDRGNDLFKCLVGVDLRTAVVGRGQRTLVLDHRPRQNVPRVIIQRGAHARRADVQYKNEVLLQRWI